MKNCSTINRALAAKKKIFSLFVALTAVMNLSATTIYLNTEGSTWLEGEAVTFIHAWGGDGVTNVQMQPVTEGSPILSIDAKDNTSIIFVRMPKGSTQIVWDGEGKYWNKTEDLTIPAEKNLFSVVDFSGEIAYGIWGTFGVLPKVALVGNYGEGDSMWGANGTNTMTDQGDGTAKVTLNLEAKNHEIKVWVDGYYLSLNGDGESLFDINRDWNHADHVNLVNNGRNFQLTADVAGDYTFTWTYATRDLVVTFPTASGMENTNANVKAVKRIINGQLVIEKNGVMYNALGAEVR